MILLQSILTGRWYVLTRHGFAAVEVSRAEAEEKMRQLCQKEAANV